MPTALLRVAIEPPHCAPALTNARPSYPQTAAGICDRGLKIRAIEVSKLSLVERQEYLDAGPDARAGVVDLLVWDVDGNVYDVEMQNGHMAGIARRARRYVSLVEGSMMEKGQSYDAVGRVVVIFICTSDPFDRNWKRYEYSYKCKEKGMDSSMELGDGTMIVFVNARGTNGDYGEELDAFLSYVRDNTVNSEYVRRVDDAVRRLRDSSVWRRSMMLWSEKYREDVAEARKEGEARGEARGIAKGEARGIAKGEAKAIRRFELLGARLGAAGRGDEIQKALRDPNYREELFREFGI